MIKKKEIVYAFIDSQNLNLGTSKDIYKGRKLIYKGWKLDFKKFRIYYERVCDQVIVVSGDGDFAVLAEFLLEKKKLRQFIIPNYKSMSTLLISLNSEKQKLAMKKPLYRSGNR